MPLIGNTGRKQGGKKKGGSKKKKAKRVAPIPDPDGPYRETLNKELFIPWNARERSCAERRAIIEEAIDAFTTAGGTETAKRESQLQLIPMQYMPLIVRALGFCPSQAQRNQIRAMILAPEATQAIPRADEEPSAVVENVEAAREKPSAALSSVEFADRSKLVQLLDGLMRTRVLSYDSQVLAHPDPASPVRASSVVYTADEASIQACFDTVWKACGSRYSLSANEERIRCLCLPDFENLCFRNTSLLSSSLDDAFTEAEREELIFALKEAGEDIIREDTFFFTLMNVQ